MTTRTIKLPDELVNMSARLHATQPPVNVEFLYDPIKMCTTPDAALYYSETLISWDQRYRDMSRKQSLEIHKANILWYAHRLELGLAISVTQAFHEAWEGYLERPLSAS